MAKIALVTYGLGLGGTDRVCCHLASGFQDLGDDVTILACANGGNGERELRPLIGDHVTLRVLTRRRWGHRQIQKMIALPGYIRWLRRERPEFVIATANNICRFAALGFRLARVRDTSKLIIKITNPVIRSKHGWTEYLRRRAYARAFRNATAILTLSMEEADLLACAFPDVAGRFRPVYNPYLTADFADDLTDGSTDAPLASGPAQGKTVMLAAGRLHPQKNFPRMLHAFAALIRLGRSDILLRLTGDGPDRKALLALVDALDIADHVELPGYVTDMPRQLACADVFLLSSDYEGLPAVVIEALARDCPVISTDCFPAARSLLEHLPHCMVVTDTDPAAFAAAIGRWLDIPRIRPQLRQHALPYSTANAVQSHRAAMTPSAS